MTDILTDANLDEYQQQAADFLYEHDGALAFLPVGAGKTIIAITALHDLLHDSVIRSALVIAPLRVGELVWPEELDKWEKGRSIPYNFIVGAPDGWDDLDWQHSRTLWGRRVHLERKLQNAKARDEPEIASLTKRIAALKKEQKAAATKVTVTHSLTLTTYENIEWLCELFPDGLPWDLIILDEGSRLSSPKSVRFKALRKALDKTPETIVWDLSASPAAEGLHKLWAQVTLLDRGKRWGKSFYQWREKFFVPIDFNHYRWRPQLGGEQAIYDDLKGLMFTVDESRLPEKPRLVERRISVQMTEEELKLYKKMVRDLVVEVDGKEIAAVNRGVQSMKLRQLAQGFLYDENKDAVRLHDHKILALQDLLEDLQGEPLLVGYDFQEDLHAILERWPGTPYLGKNVTSKQAAAAKEAWDKGVLQMFLIHPASGGHGLNLQRGGSQICWYGMTWSRELYEQLIGRIWRRGQLNACFVHHILMLDTVDDDMWEAVEHKASFQDALAQAVERLCG